MTQLEAARTGLITAEMRRVAQRECVTPEFIRDEVARRRLVIPAHKRHRGGDLAACRQAIIDHATIPIGTVPIYSMIVGRAIEDLTYDVILNEIERQAAQGVDYFTIHAGVLREHLPLVGPRVTGIVSRGGSLLAKWMLHHGRQNPMYDLFDEISAIMRQYDVTYSLDDGRRPRCPTDASASAQLADRRARRRRGARHPRRARLGRRPLARPRRPQLAPAVRARVRRRDGARPPRRGPRGRHRLLRHVRPRLVQHAHLEGDPGVRERQGRGLPAGAPGAAEPRRGRGGPGAAPPTRRSSARHRGQARLPQRPRARRRAGAGSAGRAGEALSTDSEAQSRGTIA